MDLKAKRPLQLRNERDGEMLNTPAGLSHDYLQVATSDNTRKAYRGDIRHFIGWGGLLPTAPDVILQYVQHFAEQLNPRTLLRRLTAIKQWHLTQGFSDPTAHPILRKTLSGIKKVHGRPKVKAFPLTLEALETMKTQLCRTNRLIDCRNNALLQVGFFGAFRRSELAIIQWEEIVFMTEGIDILIPRSKTDQAGEGQVCSIPYGDETLCAVRALTAWQNRSQCTTGPVFRQLTKGEKIALESIKPNQINCIIKAVAAASDLAQADQYSAHSLRRGFATEASKKGAPFGSILRQGRWRHEGTVLGYIDEGKRFDQNAVDIMLKKNKTSS